MRVMAFDVGWRHAVRAACDPIFAAADVGFQWNAHSAVGGDHPTLLWEADPLLFASRYPDSGVAESYGDGWPAPCIDYWVYIDPAGMTARLDVEGLGAPYPLLDVTGSGESDGQLIAGAFAEILQVPLADQPS